jgi:hypothetical protein
LITQTLFTARQQFTFRIGVIIVEATKWFFLHLKNLP